MKQVKEAARRVTLPHVSLDRRTLLLGAAASLGRAFCGRSESRPAPGATGKAGRLIAAARAHIGITTRYDPAYTVTAFPGGDVARSRLAWPITGRYRWALD